MDKTTAKRLLAATLVLAFAGWSVSAARPAKQIVPHKLSVIAEVPKSANASEMSEGTPLMKCMSEACRVMCSPKVAKESGRPKWCAYFAEPI